MGLLYSDVENQGLIEQVMTVPRLSPEQTLQLSLELKTYFSDHPEYQDVETFFKDQICVQPKTVSQYDTV